MGQKVITWSGFYGTNKGHLKMWKTSCLDKWDFSFALACNQVVDNFWCSRCKGGWPQSIVSSERIWCQHLSVWHRTPPKCLANPKRSFPRKLFPNRFFSHTPQRHFQAESLNLGSWSQNDLLFGRTIPGMTSYLFNPYFSQQMNRKDNFLIWESWKVRKNTWFFKQKKLWQNSKIIIVQAF